MRLYKCKLCWRVYDEWQLTKGPHNFCECGSYRFIGAKSPFFFRRLLTDFKYTIKTWIRERLNHE